MGLLDIEVVVDGDWVLSKKNESLLPEELISNFLLTEYGKDYKVIECGLTRLTCKIYSNERIDDISAKIYKYLSSRYPDDRVEHFVVVSITGSDNEKSLLNDIDNLIGWDEFKMLCHEIAMVAPQIKKNKTFDAFHFQNYLMSVNDGCGLSTALEKFYTLVTGFNLFEGKNGVLEFELTENKEDDRGPTPGEAISILDTENVIGSLVCFDISNYMERSKYPALKEFLSDLLEFEKEYIFVFRIPFVEEGALNDVYNMLSDILYVRSVAVLPFSISQTTLSTVCKP